MDVGSRSDGRTVVIPNSRRERNKKTWRILSAASVTFLGLVLLLPAPPVRAQELQVEVVQPPTSFLTADRGKEDGKIEPSGVATIGDGKFILVACDKTHASASSKRSPDGSSS